MAADLINVVNPAYNTYNLDGPIGPFFDAVPFFAQFQNVSTALGNLSFSAMSDVTFQARGTAEAAQVVPIVSPAGLGAMVALLALGGAFLLRRGVS